MYLAVGILLLILLLIVGVPVFWTFLAVTIFLIFSLGYDPVFLLPYGYSQLNSPLLLAIPMFIVAGKVIERGGIGDAIVNWTETIVGKFKGGLGITTVVACAIFGSISGSALAALSTIGSIMFGKLERDGYDRGFSASLVASSSILGLLIPPSGIMILYAWMANVSVLASFLSTLIPGLILVTLFSIINIVYIRRYGNTLKPLPSVPFTNTSSGPVHTPPPLNFPRATLRALPALALPVIVLGGIYSGIVTTVEAAVLASLYAIPVGVLIYRKLRLSELPSVFIDAGKTTGVVMVMAFSMMILSRVFTMESLPNSISLVLTSVSDNPVLVLLLINLFVIVMGMLIDDVSGILLLTPILLPLATSVGVDPIHFAAILGVNLGLANITPPTAPLLYFGGQVGKASIRSMLKPTFVLILLAWVPVLLLTTYVPSLSLWLPELILDYQPVGAF